MSLSSTPHHDINCSCPVGYTDPLFSHHTHHKQGYGTVSPHNIHRLACAQACDEDYLLIRAKKNYNQEICACHADLGCRFTSRVFPTQPDHAIIVIPDNLAQATQVVKCYHTEGEKVSAVDMLLCAEFNLHYQHTPPPPETITCLHKQWYDASARHCKACKQCSGTTPGIESACTALKDTVCRACAQHEYVSEVDGRCHACDADQEYDPKQKRCVRQQRNLYQGKCHHAPGHVYLPWVQACSPCPRNTRQVENRCEPCDANFFTSGPAATACEPCPAAHVRAVGEDQCRECEEGNRVQAGECQLCPKNRVRLAGMSDCVPCLPGNSDRDRLACEACEKIEDSNCVQCDAGEEWNAVDARCDRCGHGGCAKNVVDTQETPPLPIKAGEEFVLEKLHMRFMRGVDGEHQAKGLEETEALLYASDDFLRGASLWSEYRVYCENNYEFVSDSNTALYSCNPK
tara:strand:+ start:265 stop:1638 length:1374 start_codon:yes stop_codon:yes gene_type:complete